MCASELDVADRKRENAINTDKKRRNLASFVAGQEDGLISANNSAERKENNDADSLGFTAFLPPKDRERRTNCADIAHQKITNGIEGTSRFFFLLRLIFFLTSKSYFF